MALAKKLNLSCRSAREDAEEKAREQEIDDEMNELMNDAFMQVSHPSNFVFLVYTPFPTVTSLPLFRVMASPLQN